MCRGNTSRSCPLNCAGIRGVSGAPVIARGASAPVEAGQRWAMEYEISDGTNMPGVITREQLVAMLFRYAVKNGLEAVTLSENLTQFTDASDISAWAVSAMQWAVGQGLIQGSNGQLRPQANASRAEVATILMRFCELLNK